MVSDSNAHKVCQLVIRQLREERKRRGLSIYVVAQKSGLSQQMVSYVERELRSPSLETALRIALAMGADFPKMIRVAVKTVLGGR